MATLLEKYWNMKISLDAGMKTAKPGPAQIWEYQELLYRIEVLQVCQMFLQSAPESVNTGDLLPHYQIMNAYIENLVLERRSAAECGDTAIKIRDTAYDNLRSIIDDYRKRFGSFSPGNDASRYGKEISMVCQTVLPAWVQYRQTCTYIKEENPQ